MKQALCGADTPVREMSEATTSRGQANGVVSTLFRCFEMFVAILQEIFDESAYERFLIRTQLKSSRSAYKLFQQENEQSKSRKPRCC
jgi:hypothetical protein